MSDVVERLNAIADGTLMEHHLASERQDVLDAAARITELEAALEQALKNSAGIAKLASKVRADALEEATVAASKAHIVFDSGRDIPGEYVREFIVEAIDALKSGAISARQQDILAGKE